MAAPSPSSSFPIISITFTILLFLLLHPHLTKSSTNFAFPLQTTKLQSFSTPTSPPNSKLRFHRNISLTVTLAVGTPPQNITMVLDTGSELSWLPCNNSTFSSFNPRASSSYTPIPCSSQTCVSQTTDLPNRSSCDSTTNTCRVSISYADASTADGALSSDLFFLGNSPPRRTSFGCMSSIYSPIPQDSYSSGILGMNRGQLSFVTQTNTRRFSYCISDRDAGVLLLGASNFLPLNYTPFVQIPLPLPYFDRVAYSVQLQSIRVGAKTLPIPQSVLLPDHSGAGQTMVDSGTQFSFLLGPAYQILKTEFLRQTNGVLTPLNEPEFVFQGAFDMCFRGTEEVTAAAMGRIPAVVLEFKGAEVAVEGKRLLYRVEGERRGSGKEGVWCFTFGNADLVPMEAFVIGHHHQQNVWVEYDLENRRVGFAPVRCDLAGRKLGVIL